MKLKKRIKKLECNISKMEEILQKNSLTLTDVENPNVKVVLSVKAGVFSTDKITTTTSENIDNITTTLNS